MKTVVGIDVSKKSLDACLRPSSGKPVYGKFANDEAGHVALVDWMEAGGVQIEWVVMEATGTYHERVASTLVGAEYRVAVVNPARMKAFAKSLALRNKTDKLDANLIAHFGAVMDLHEWLLPDPVQRELRDLVRRREQLLKMQHSERNRMASGPHSAVVLDSFDQIEAMFKAEIAKLEKAIAACVKHDPALRHGYDLLMSIPGIGKVSAWLLLAELPNFNTFHSPKELVAYVGLNPKLKQSGESRGTYTPISKTGHSLLRKKLYFAGIAAKRSNPLIKPLCDRMVAAGKQKKEAVIAAMRKLLHLVYGILKSGKPFDPHYLERQVAFAA